MLRYLKNIFTRSTPSVGHTSPVLSSQNLEETPTYNGPGPKDRIQFAFSSGGKNYFCFSNDINIPYERMYAAIDIYRELDYGVNPTILKAHSEAIEVLLTNPKLKPEKKLLEVGVLNARLAERLELAISLQLSIKLATVKYFDENEDPFDYQHDYNLAKIEHWSKSLSIPAFFFGSATKSIHDQWERIRAEFSDHFKSGDNHESPGVEASYFFDSLRLYKQRFAESLRFARETATDHERLVRRSCYEYYLKYALWVEALKKRKAMKT